MKHEKYKYKVYSGFSFIELLLVIAIISIIAASSAPFMTKFLKQNELEVSTDKVVSTIRKSQSYAMSGKENDVWGFCMDGNKIKLYQGSCVDSLYEEDFDLSKVSVSGFTDVYFSGDLGRRGEPSQAVQITISNDAGTNSVSLNYAGGLEFN